jgi:ATP-dependent Zn protease
MKVYLTDQYNTTTRILAENKDLLLETAKYLVENRCMFADDFKTFVEKYGKNMPKTGTISETYWIDILKK